jgi:hypothetical protein
MTVKVVPDDDDDEEATVDGEEDRRGTRRPSIGVSQRRVWILEATPPVCIRELSIMRTSS